MYIQVVRGLFSALHGFATHLEETVFGFGLWEAVDRLGCFVGILLCQSPCLLDAVALGYDVAGLSLSA